MNRAYLAVSLSFGRDLKFAKRIAEALNNLGYEIASSWVLDEDPSWGLSAEEITRRDLEAIEHSDVLIADVSRPSTGVGMEIMYALMKGVKVVCVTKSGLPVSGLVAGSPKISLIVIRDEEELEEKLRGVLVGKKN